MFKVWPDMGPGGIAGTVSGISILIFLYFSIAYCVTRTKIAKIGCILSGVILLKVLVIIVPCIMTLVNPSGFKESDDSNDYTTESMITKGWSSNIKNAAGAYLAIKAAKKFRPKLWVGHLL